MVSLCMTYTMVNSHTAPNATEFNHFDLSNVGVRPAKRFPLQNFLIVLHEDSMVQSTLDTWYRKSVFCRRTRRTVLYSRRR